MESLPHDVVFYWCRLLLDSACRGDDDARVVVARLARACRAMQARLVRNERAVERLRERRLEQCIARWVDTCGYAHGWYYTATASPPRQWQVTIAKRDLAFTLDDAQMAETMREWLVRLELKPSDVDGIMDRLHRDSLEPVPPFMITVTTPHTILDLTIKTVTLSNVNVYTRRYLDNDPMAVARHLVGALLHVLYPTSQARHEALSRHCISSSPRTSSYLIKDEQH